MADQLNNKLQQFLLKEDYGGAIDMLKQAYASNRFGCNDACGDGVPIDVGGRVYCSTAFYSKYLIA